MAALRATVARTSRGAWPHTRPLAVWAFPHHHCARSRYKTQHRLQAGGTLVLGGQQRRVGCRDGEGLGPDGAPCGWAGVLDPARGFTGNVQNLRLWNYVLSPADVGQGMVWPFVRSRVRVRV